MNLSLCAGTMSQVVTEHRPKCHAPGRIALPPVHAAKKRTTNTSMRSTCPTRCAERHASGSSPAALSRLTCSFTEQPLDGTKASLQCDAPDKDASALPHGAITLVQPVDVGSAAHAEAEGTPRPVRSTERSVSDTEDIVEPDERHGHHLAGNDGCVTPGVLGSRSSSPALDRDEHASAPALASRGKSVLLTGPEEFLQPVELDTTQIPVSITAGGVSQSVACYRQAAQSPVSGGIDLTAQCPGSSSAATNASPVMSSQACKVDSQMLCEPFPAAACRQSACRLVSGHTAVTHSQSGSRQND